MSKNYFKSYVWLIDLLQRYERLTLKEIQGHWMRSSLNDDKKEIAPRTFSNHIESIRDVFGIEIRCDRRDNTYFIYNDDEVKGDGIREWMMEALSLNNLLGESAGLKNQIMFEAVPSSYKHLHTIIDALRGNRTLNISYQSYKMSEPRCFILKPYFVREFKRRWYLFAAREGGDGRSPHMYALDRMLTAEIGKEHFEISGKFSSEEYFSNIYGVRNYDDSEAISIELKAYGAQAKFFRSLPFHNSQEEITTEADYVIFRYRFIPDFDFMQDVLSFGPSVEVLKPESLRQEIFNMILRMKRIYEIV